MYFVYLTKVVGLSHQKVVNAVEQGDYVILVENPENPIDPDCIEVYNAEREFVGYIANSERTLSPNNRKNGNISASELKNEIDFTGKEFYGEVIKTFSSCLYLEVNDGKWSYINKSVDEPSEIEILKSEIESLKALVTDLQDQVVSLKTIVTVGSDENSLPKTSNGKTLYTFVGLSHYPGQDHLGYDLSIVEEPIFPNAKGTSLFLKSGDYRIGVAPSSKKKQYCLDHNIPYCDSKTLKGKSFEGNVIIEEIVYDEYAVVSV